MGAHELIRADLGTEPVLGERRSHVLAVLRHAGAALTAGDVAERVHLHPNTARFHLDALVEAGLAERDTEHRDQPGRPHILYTARPEAAADRRNYQLLAEILTGYLAANTPQPSRAALEAGWAWGRYLAERPPPFRRIDPAVAIQQMARTLDDIGFAPETDTTGGEQRLLLHHCPFREVAGEHQEIVCSIHLGLMQGLLAELDAPVAAERLDPLVEPDLCVTHLAPRDDAAPAEPRFHD